MDEYVLEHIATDNVIGADFFVPFTVLRLQQAAGSDREATLLVHLSDIGEMGKARRELLLSWSTDSMAEEEIALQEHIVTEWAAVGIACVLVPLYAGLRILQVTQLGERFDYWVGDDEHEYALEVSGTVAGSLTGRHAAKVRQLRENPYGVDGYVAITRFAGPESIFSFHRYEETR